MKNLHLIFGGKQKAQKKVADELIRVIKVRVTKFCAKYPGPFTHNLL